VFVFDFYFLFFSSENKEKNTEKIFDEINKYCTQGKKKLFDVLQKITEEFKEYEIPEELAKNEKTENKTGEEEEKNKSKTNTCKRKKKIIKIKSRIFFVFNIFLLV